jgi:hypothetical protein
MQRLLAFLLLLAPLLLAAETDVPADSAMRLTVKPVLCITDKRTPSCDLPFLVYWQSGTKGYYCLFSDFDEAPLRCWNDNETGRVTDDRSVREEFSYWMTAEEYSVRLAAVTVEVLRMDSDDRRRRRRTRHVWDIN